MKKKIMTMLVGVIMIAGAIILSIMPMVSALPEEVAFDTATIIAGIDGDGSYSDAYSDGGNDWEVESARTYLTDYVDVKFDFTNGRYNWFEFDIEITDDAPSGYHWITVYFTDSSNEGGPLYDEGINYYSVSAPGRSKTVDYIRIGKSKFLDDFNIEFDYVHGEFVV